MANLKLTNLASYKAYWADIAAKHKLIQGFKFGDKDVVRNDNRSDITNNFLWASPYDSFKYSGSDNIVKTKPASVGFFIVPNSELFEDEEDAYTFCEGVIEDIISRLLKDKTGQDVAGEWQMIATAVSSFAGKHVQVKIGATKYVGCELRIDFIDNTNMAYDATKWN